MRIKKAIELLQQDLKDPGSVDIRDLNKAQDMGIGALQILSQNKILLMAASFLCDELGAKK